MIPTSKLIKIYYVLILLFVTYSLTMLLKHITTVQTFQGQAQENTVVAKIVLQGNFDQEIVPSYKAQAAIYTEEGKAKDLNNILVSYEGGNNFSLTIDIDGLDLNKKYSLFIKPDKYLGRVFCSIALSGTSCTSPQFIFTNGVNNIDLTGQLFLSGDLKNQDGKVDSYDLSKIISDLGNISEEYLESDINSDLVVNTLDYSLALYSISQNATDDKINIGGPPSPTSTPHPTPATPTSTPTPSPTPSAQPTASPTSTPTLTPTILPTTTPSPTVTPTPASQTGSCYGTLSGRIYIDAGPFGTYCRIIDGVEMNFCAASQNQCGAAGCVEKALQLMREQTSECSSGAASLDEERTSISCTTQFEAGQCTIPPPPVNCEDTLPRC